MLTRFLLIRHGQSTWNAQRRWQGQADPPLTEEGEEQAWQAAKQLGTFDALIASDLQRARETAAIIAGHLGIGPVLLDERLRENDAGEWEGLTRDEIEAGWPGWLAAQRLPPGFESVESSTTRSLACLIDHAQQHPGSEILAVTHGGIIRWLCSLFAVPDDVHFRNLSGMWFDVRIEPRVDVQAGDIVHLLPETPAVATTVDPDDASRV